MFALIYQKVLLLEFNLKAHAFLDFFVMFFLWRKTLIERRVGVVKFFICFTHVPNTRVHKVGLLFLKVILVFMASKFGLRACKIDFAHQNVVIDDNVKALSVV